MLIILNIMGGGGVSIQSSQAPIMTPLQACL